MSENPVLTSGDRGVSVITLNRPEKRNALNDELIAGLKNALEEAANDPDTYVILLKGSGKDFCSGADLESLERIAAASIEENLADARLLAELFIKIRKIDKPVIAAVHGRALAGGCGLASSCDLVVAAKSAIFGYPEIKIGFVPAIVMAFLRRSVPEKITFELTTRGRQFTAEEGFNYGLVNRVFDDETFPSDSFEYAADYSKFSRSAVKMTKRLLYDIDYNDLNSAIEKGIAPLILTGPPAVTGFAGGRPKVEEIMAYFPALIPKSLVETSVEIIEV